MPKVKAVIADGAHYGWKFICPGCDWPVVLPSSGPTAWHFNGDVEKPMFAPSVLQTHEYLTAAGRVKHDEFYQAHGRHPTREELPYDGLKRCHAWVGCNGAAPGWITFLSDSTHKLRGQTVELPDVNSDWEGDDGN